MPNMSFKRKMKGEPAFPIFLGGVRISVETAAKIAAGMERAKKNARRIHARGDPPGAGVD